MKKLLLSLLKIFAYFIKSIGIIIGFPGMILTGIGLGLVDIYDSLINYCNLKND